MDKVSLDEIFRVPNTEENLIYRELICRAYRVAKKVPPHEGLNIYDVIAWAKEILDNK